MRAVDGEELARRRLRVGAVGKAARLGRGPDRDRGCNQRGLLHGVQGEPESRRVRERLDAELHRDRRRCRRRPELSGRCKCRWVPRRSRRRLADLPDRARSPSRHDRRRGSPDRGTRHRGTRSRQRPGSGARARCHGFEAAAPGSPGDTGCPGPGGDPGPDRGRGSRRGRQRNQRNRPEQTTQPLAATAARAKPTARPRFGAPMGSNGVPARTCRLARHTEGVAEPEDTPARPRIRRRTGAPTGRRGPGALRPTVRRAHQGDALLGDARPDGDHREARRDLPGRWSPGHLDLPAADIRRADDADRAGVRGPRRSSTGRPRGLRR